MVPGWLLDQNQQPSFSSSPNIDIERTTGIANAHANLALISLIWAQKARLCLESCVAVTLEASV